MKKGLQRGGPGAGRRRDRPLLPAHRTLIRAGPDSGPSCCSACWGNCGAGEHILHAPFGFDTPAIDDIVFNAVRHSFLDAERKRQLQADFVSDLAPLKQSIL